MPGSQYNGYRFNVLANCRLMKRRYEAKWPRAVVKRELALEYQQVLPCSVTHQMLSEGSSDDRSIFLLDNEENVRIFCEQEEFTDHFRNSNDIRDAQYNPESLKPADTEYQPIQFKGTNFTNVSFSKTTITQVEFRNCTFKGCLFVGTRFVDCRFNRCTFKECNPHRVEFDNTYIDPSVFEGMLDFEKHSNIGMNLFQQLYDNSVRTNQREFADAAEFNRSVWKRALLKYEFRDLKELTPFQYYREWLLNYFYYLFVGYGIRFRFLAAWICIFAVASVGINFIFWDSLDIIGKDGPAPKKEFIDVLYYTMTIPSGLGELTPSSNLGRWIFLGEMFSSLIIVTLFATWVVKRALR